MQNREEIIETMRRSGRGSPPYLQNKLKITYQEAKKICDELGYPPMKIENGCNAKNKLK